MPDILPEVARLAAPKVALDPRAPRALHELASEVFPILRESGPEGIWDCRPAFLCFLASDFFVEFANYELTKVTEDRFYQFTDGATAAAMNIVRSESWHLSLRFAGKQSADRAKVLWSSTEHMLLGVGAVPGTGPLSYGLLQQPAPEPHDVFDPERGLIHLGERVLEPGEAAEFHAGRDLIDIKPAEAPSVLLVLSSRTVVPYRWEYDHDTLSPVRMMAAEEAPGRLNSVIRFLAAAGDPSSCRACGPGRHSDHTVRWNATRAALVLDQRTGMELLERATEDPHPHVKQTARRSLHALLGDVQSTTADRPSPTHDPE